MTTLSITRNRRSSNENPENPQQKQQPKTAKEIIDANVKCLIEQLEAGHSDALTAYLNAMGRFHNYCFGNILEIARQRPTATRVAGTDMRNPPGVTILRNGDRWMTSLSEASNSSSASSAKPARTAVPAPRISFDGRAGGSISKSDVLMTPSSWHRER
jgi:hypothetical protein